MTGTSSAAAIGGTIDVMKPFLLSAQDQPSRALAGTLSPSPATATPS